MSSRPVLIALVLALLLAVGAYFILKSPAGSGAGTGPASVVPAGQAVLRFDPASVVAISLRGGGATQVLDRHANEDWYWRPESRALHQHLINADLMQKFLRYLVETKAVATPDESARLADSPPPITLTLHLRAVPPAVGQTIAIRLSPRALGGQVLTEITYPDTTPGKPTHALAPEALLTLLTNPGPIAWRDTRLFPAGASAASRITFTDRTKTKGFTLAKRNAAWYLTDPIPAPANPNAVARLFASLDSLQINRWIDDPATTRAAAGLEPPSGPSATLTLETDIRGYDTAANQPTSTTQRTVLTLGNPADAGGSNLFASMDSGGGGGATIVSINAAPLGAFAADLAQLITPAASKTLPADVTAIEIKGRQTITLSRQALASGQPGWGERLDAEAPVLQDPTRAAATNQLLANLTTTPADVIATTISPHATPRATITLRGSDGNPLEELEAFQAGPTVILRTGKVYRAYNKPAPELHRWLTTLK